MKNMIEEYKMKLGTIKNNSRDGMLVVVSRDNQRMLPATGIAQTMQEALDNWNSIAPKDVKEVIEHANKKRYSLLSEKVQDKSITITKEWRD